MTSRPTLLLEAETPPASEQTDSPDQLPHTTMTDKEKIFTIIMASFAAFISPVSASIYYPSLNLLAQDLHVTVSTINLTITVYMICIQHKYLNRRSSVNLNYRYFRHWHPLLLGVSQIRMDVGPPTSSVLRSIWAQI